MTGLRMCPGAWTGAGLDCARCCHHHPANLWYLHVISSSGCEHLQLHLILLAPSFLSSTDSSTRHLRFCFWEWVNRETINCLRLFLAVYLIFTNEHSSTSNNETSLPEFSAAKALTEMEIAPKIPFLRIVSKFLFEKKMWKRMFSSN